jgi:hypothetical protein
MTDPLSQVHKAPKVFRTPTLLRLRIIDPIPLLFSSPEPRKTRIGSFDTEFDSAAAVEGRLWRLISALSDRPILTAEFHSVDAHAAPDPAELSATLGCPVLKFDCDFDPASDTQTFVLKILPERWTDEVRTELEAVIKAKFCAAEVHLCERCGCLFCHEDGSACDSKRTKDIGHRRAEGRSLSKLFIAEGKVFGGHERMGL